MSIVTVDSLSKSYRVSDKQPGVLGTLKHFFRRQYRTIDAVRDVSFKLEPGQVVGFLGPNGAGKTTTLKMLTGLIHPTTGHVEVAGYVPFDRDRRFLSTISLVMGQKQQLLWDLPAMDSLQINAAVYEIPQPQFQQTVKQLADMLQLGGELHQPVRKLSLGQRMKAELLAALVHRPQVLFLDEPTLGLDVNAQVAVRQFLIEYNRLYGATLLITSHYMADITALCERVLLIHEGQLRYDGRLDDIVRTFSPYRLVQLELGPDHTVDELRSFGEIDAVEGRVVRLIVRREDLTSTIERLLNQLQVDDLTVTDPPIEQIVGKLFQKPPTRDDQPGQQPSTDAAA